MKINKNYIKNKDLYNEIIISKEIGELTEEAVQMLITMSNHIIKILKFKNIDDIDDAIQTALLKCILYWKNFDPSKSKNAFAYFTQIIKNGITESFNKLNPEKNRNGVIISLQEVDLLDRI